MGADQGRARPRLRRPRAQLSEPTLELALVDLKPALVTCWRRDFAGVAGVEAVEGSIFDVACDALVSPANSFGFMDGGLDLAISQHFGWHVQERLQARIRARHHGELLVGQADAVPTDDPAIPLVIAAPTMRVPMRLGLTANPFLALRAVLLWVRHAHLDDGRPAREVVRRVAIPGLGTGVGGVPSGVCSRQMRAAYDQVVAGTPGFPRSWNEACARHEGLLR